MSSLSIVARNDDPPTPQRTPSDTPSQTPSQTPMDLSLALNDRGRARLFQAAYGGRYHWVEERKSWFVWDEEAERWQVGEQAMERLANRFLDELAADAERASCDELLSGPGALGNRRVKVAMIAESKACDGVGASADLFDADPYLMGVENGVVDLRTGKLRRNWREAYVTMHTPCPYHPGKVYPHGDWDRLLETSIPDVPTRNYLQAFFGSALTGSNHQEKFALLVGLGGTGKSTIVNTIADALGPYAMAANADTFSAHRPGSIREDLAAFEGKRLVHQMELPDGSQLDPMMIKSLSGGDTIRARRLHQNGRMIRPTWSCVVGSNTFPSLRGRTDSGWWRRIIAVPFYSRPRKIDYTLKDRLRYQHEVVLAWLIRGSKRYYRDRVLNPHHVHRVPAAIRREIAKYRVEQDHIGAWQEAHLEPVRGGVCEAGALFAAYLKWCDKMDVPKMQRVNSTWFGRYLTQQGYGSRRSHGKRYRVGVRLRTSEEIRATNRVQHPYKVALTDFEAEAGE